MKDNAAEELTQEPLPRPIREIEKMFEAGQLGSDPKIARFRLINGLRWYNDWEYSGHNPDFRSAGNPVSGEAYTSGDRWTAVWREIPAHCRRFAEWVLIEDKTIRDWQKHCPIYNRTRRERNVLTRTLWDILDKIGERYKRGFKETEPMRKTI
jgi:hypothetical protein